MNVLETRKENTILSNQQLHPSLLIFFLNVNCFPGFWAKREPLETFSGIFPTLFLAFLVLVNNHN